MENVFSSIDAQSDLRDLIHVRPEETVIEYMQHVEPLLAAIAQAGKVATRE